MKFGIVVFPGTWSDRDCHHAIATVLGQQAEYVWHDESDIARFDAIVLPGGFSYGDYLRCGAIASFSPVMDAVRTHAAAGKLVIGICNGFQVLCESKLLPGVLMRNDHLEFRCAEVEIRTEHTGSRFTHLGHHGQVLRMPISHGEGNYQADDETIATLERTGRVLFRYCDGDGKVSQAANPNGSINSIAGILNERGNVLGMMPHPERACEPILGGEDGNLIFRSMFTEVRALAGSRR